MASMGDKYDLITPRNEQFSELHFTLTCEWAFKQNEKHGLELGEGQKSGMLFFDLDIDEMKTN